MEEKLKQQPSDCLKVVLYGPESTGKTTLCEQLADHYETLWVPEYARQYLQDKWDREQKICEKEDLLPIAAGQMQLENQYAAKANKVLFCDTDLLETKVYSEVYYSGICDPVLDAYALNNQYDLYFLTYIDTPWEPDDLRDRPNERERMFEAFHQALLRYDKPFVLLKGNRSERFNFARRTIDKLIETKE